MRPSRDEWAMDLAKVTSGRATCLRRQVGCVLLNNKGHVLATGYNGVASSLPHCNHHDLYDPEGFPHACPGANAASGTQLDACQAIHAEQNALLQCTDVYSIDTCYVTTAPCITCTKLLLNTGCQRIVFSRAYVQPEAQKLWVAAGRIWEQFFKRST